MNRITFLVLFMLFAPCGTSRADIISLSDGSIFEGEPTRKEGKWLMFRVAKGTVGMMGKYVASVEEREPTADERTKLLRFKTGRYDVTLKADFMTPFENEVMDEGFVLADENPDMSDETMTRILGEKFDIPPIIVDMIYDKWFRMW